MALDVLRCPVTGEALRPMTAEEIGRVNERLAHGSLCHRDGTPVPRELRSGLVDVGGQNAYRVEDGIATLLEGRAIVLEENGPRVPEAATLRREKQSVQLFYDEVGWQKAENGQFVDTNRFVDQRALVQDYLAKCQLRVKRHLNAEGLYLLDVGSGPVQDAESRSYADGFDRRICIDLSTVALAAARGNLGDRGVYVIGDATSLPFRDDAVDGVVSLHAIYHVPKDEQITAFKEIYRVLKPGSSAVIVYFWQTIPWRDRSLPMRVGLLPSRVVRRAARRFRSGAERPSHDTAEPLYFHAHDYNWFMRQDWPFDAEVLVSRSVTKDFLAKYVRGAAGRRFLAAIYWLEERFPHIAGRLGKYPMIVIRKP